MSGLSLGAQNVPECVAEVPRPRHVGMSDFKPSMSHYAPSASVILVLAFIGGVNVGYWVIEIIGICEELERTVFNN